MPLLEQAWEARATSQVIGHPRDDVVGQFFGGGPSAAGVPVSQSIALTCTAIFRAISLIAGTVSKLPITVRRVVKEDTTEAVPDHPLQRLLNIQPNAEMDAMSFREALQGHVMGWGSGTAEIERNRRGDILALWPIRPDRVVPDRRNGAVVFDISKKNGGTTTLGQDDVFRVFGFSPDGIVGYSPITVCREAIGLTLGQERAAGSFIGNGSRPSGILMTEQKMQTTAMQSLREAWDRMQSGAGNYGRPAVLDQGFKWQAMGIAPNEAQFLESRQFQISEIARIFGISNHLLMDLTRSTNNNIEHQGLEFLIYCLDYWLKRWEIRTLFSLFTEKEQRRGFYIVHDTDELVRTDLKSRTEANKSALDAGYVTINQVRVKEHMNPVGPEGDVIRVPLNYEPAEDLLKRANDGEEPGLDENGNPKAPKSETVEEAAQQSKIQSTALTGQQITGLLEIASQISSGSLTKEAGKAVMRMSFPLVDPIQVDLVVDSLEIVEKPPATAPQLPPIDPQNAPKQHLIAPANDAVRSAVSGVLDEALGRMARQHAHAARTAAKKPGEFINWLDDFNARHEEKTREAIAPAVKAWVAIHCTTTDDSECRSRTWDFAHRQIEQARTELLDVAGSAKADDLPEKVSAWATAWESRTFVTMTQETS